MSIQVLQTIGIRGTDFTVTVDELGRTLVVLLPDKTGFNLSGSVIVSNRGGEIILDEGMQQLWYKVMKSYQKKLLSHKVLLFL